MNYRIVELEKQNGSVTYVLEEEDSTNEWGWKSVWRNEDLALIREAKAKRERGIAGPYKSRRVVE